MTEYSGQETVDRLGRKDLNLDGSIINLAVVGSSRFYNFEVFEKIMHECTQIAHAVRPRVGHRSIAA